MRFLAVVSAILLLSGVAGAQSKLLPGIEVFGGYSHLSFQSGGLGFRKWTQTSGWDAAISIPQIYKGLGITLDGSGDYATPLAQYNYLVGPQYKWEFSRFRFIAHGLYGRAQTRILHAGSTFIEASDRRRALAFGGEVDFPLGNRFSIRLVQADYLVTSAFGGTQDNLRLSTGLIVRFGKH
jgi:hypothetical protein